MSQAEMIQTYWETVDDDPHALAELYLDYPSFSTIEFLIFTD